MFVWTNIAPDAEEQLNEWYVRDHLEERVTIPGFVRARRFAAVEAKRKYLALYETLGTDVFVSPAYEASINNPRPMTVAMIRQFSDTARVISHVRRREGDDGGFVATVTIEVTPEERAALAEQLETLDLHGLATRRGIVGMGLMQEDPEISLRQNAGKALRPVQDGRADWVATVEGFDVEAVRAAGEAFLTRLRLPPEAIVESGLYRFLCGKNAIAA